MADPETFSGYLRARRERVRPEDVGLPPAGPSRRTPGLRREELATLAGISVDYLIRLEQGRERNPSGPVLAALARALRLDDDERGHLGSLAMQGANPGLCPTDDPAASDEAAVRPSVRTIVEALDPLPAFVLAPSTRVLAWNRPYHRLLAPAGLFDHGPPHLLRVTFGPRGRALYPDWDVVAREQLANLRAAWARRPRDEELRQLVDELSADEAFRTRWQEHAVVEKRRGTKALQLPGGRLTLAFDALVLPDPGDLRLVTYQGATAADARRLAELTAAADGPEGRAALRILPSA